jgi:hypothetical protein
MNMGVWIPLCQSLVWPIFIGIVILCFRKRISSLLHTIVDRVEKGDSLQLGSGGISIQRKELLKLPAQEKPDEGKKVATKDSDILASDIPVHLLNSMYIIHQISSPRVDNDGLERRVVRVYLDADNEDFLDRVERVEYHLHPTFPHPIRVMTNREKNFELLTRAWGQFNLSANVYVKGHKKPIILMRYINFH